MSQTKYIVITIVVLVLGVLLFPIIQQSSQGQQSPTEQVDTSTNINNNNINNNSNNNNNNNNNDNIATTIETTLLPYTCTTYDPYISHLSTKTPYAYRHVAYPHPQCYPNNNNNNDNKNTSNNTNNDDSSSKNDKDLKTQIDKKMTPPESQSQCDHGDQNCNLATINNTTPLPCFGPACPIQFAPTDINATKVCKLRHISHVNRHGTRNPTKPGQINKTASLFHDANAKNGLLINDNNSTSPLVWIPPSKKNNKNNKDDQSLVVDGGDIIEDKYIKSNSDPIFSDEAGGHVSDLGRIELFGIGHRLKQQVDLFNFQPEKLFGDVTFKKRTLQSLLALLCGMGLYDVQGIATGGQMKTMVQHSTRIIIDNVEYSEPHVRITIPQELLQKVKHIIDPKNHQNKDKNNQHINYTTQDMSNLLELIHYYESQFIQQIIKRYPVHKHPSKLPLFIKLVTFDQNLKPKILALTIPPMPIGTSAVLELACESNHTFPDMIEYNGERGEVTRVDINGNHSHNIMAPNQHDNNNSNHNIEEEDSEHYRLINSPIEFFESDAALNERWKSAVLRYFDECGQYNLLATKDPPEWKQWMRQYIVEVCGAGTQCDLALHSIFTREYIDNEILSTARTKALNRALVKFYGTFIEDMDNINTLTTSQMKEIGEWTISNIDSFKQGISKDLQGKLDGLVYIDQLEQFNDPVNAITDIIVDWVNDILTKKTSILTPETKPPKDKSGSNNWIQQCKGGSDNNKTGQAKVKDKKDKANKKANKIKFPSIFLTDRHAMTRLYSIVTNNLQNTSTKQVNLNQNNSKAQFMVEFIKDYLVSDAESRYSHVKKIYALCSLQLSVHSPSNQSEMKRYNDNNNNNAPQTQDDKNVLQPTTINTQPYANQFCGALASSLYDPLVFEVNNFKKQHNIDFVTNDQKLIDDGVENSFINNLNQFDEFLNTIYSQLISSINTPSIQRTEAIKPMPATATITTTTPVRNDVNPNIDNKIINTNNNNNNNNNPISPYGSTLFYHSEYLTDIAQLAKKGAYVNITLGSACPLLQALLPDFDEKEDSMSTSMSLYGAHAETVLPLIALITGSPQTPTHQPPIPAPHTDDWLLKMNINAYHNQKHENDDNTTLPTTSLEMMDKIYNMDQMSPKYHLTDSKLVDGLVMLKATGSDRVIEAINNENNKNDENVSVDGMLMNPAWRSSFHTPMAANVGVHIYDCMDIDEYEQYERSITNNKDNNNQNNIPLPKSTLYAQLLLNEEVIPWPGNMHENSTDVNGKVYISENNNQDETKIKDKKSVLLPKLQRYDYIKQFFAKRYEELGMRSCNIKDWHLACYAKDFVVDANGADE